ncbi:MAG: hypothetical protein M3P18_09655 [Actinomycetota bacterium]|nr:hypothetical protein [Actinomycetota bacterium]
MSRPPDPPLSTTEWVPGARSPYSLPVWRIAWLVPCALTGVIVATTVGVAAGALATGSAGLALYLWVRGQGRLALRSTRAVPIEPDGAPRLANIAEGLAATAGCPVPSLWLIDEGGPNALVCRAGGVPVIAATRSLVDGYSRTELEAVVAHCLVRLRDSRRLSETVALGPLSVTTGPFPDFSQDAAAAALTRYPPALASAIVKARPRSDRFRALWLVADGPFNEPQSARAEMLLDL